ncbi:MAG TPA: (d)CMP kinase [Nocardioidaceae bacterium]|nr:(d)CMP kinase [Nocardioidaceae bacterium]
MSTLGSRGRDIVIAVDGPSGSGKSSTARGVAKRLRMRYLDTGAMYRAVTWALLQRGVDVDDSEAIAAAAADVRLDVGTDPARPTIDADGTDVAGPIRGPQVTASVSAVSAVPDVRRLLVDLQRELIGAGGIVVEGRDIGAVVAPDAELKIFLTADSAQRAARRHAEVGGAPEHVATTEADLARRDTLDSTRAASPLTQAADAVVVDTTDVGLDEVIDRIADMVAARRAEAGVGRG